MFGADCRIGYGECEEMALADLVRSSNQRKGVCFVIIVEGRLAAEDLRRVVGADKRVYHQ
jgi:hypothetical protein